MDKVNSQGQVSILTEYELSRAEELLPIYFQDHSALTAIRELIASHRELFKANAELSFRNGKLLREVEYLRSNYELKEETK